MSPVCSPMAGGGSSSRAGVAEKRGAGAGWTTSSRVTNVPRATLCGCCGASDIDNTGKTHPSTPAKSSSDAARVREANSAASRSRSAGQERVGRVRRQTKRHRCRVAREGTRRPQRPTDRYPPSVRIDVIEWHLGKVEHVGCSPPCRPQLIDLPSSSKNWAISRADPSSIAANSPPPARRRCIADNSAGTNFSYASSSSTARVVADETAASSPWRPDGRECPCEGVVCRCRDRLGSGHRTVLAPTRRPAEATVPRIAFECRSRKCRGPDPAPACTPDGAA